MTPEFEELFDRDDADAGRLRRVHDLLVQAGPPPELGPELEAPPTVLERDDLERRRRRRRQGAHPFALGGFRYLAAAAALAAIAFGLGRASANHRPEFAGARTVAFTATARAPQASAVLQIAGESRGNWPMRITADELPRLPGDDYYAVFLTRNGKVVGPCGFFHVTGGHVEAYLNAPYRLAGAGWIVTRQHPGDRTLGPVFLKTTATV